MARREARPNNSTVTGWGDKSQPPEFLVHHHDRRPTRGWWGGLTGSGHWLIAVVAVGAAAIVVVLVVSITGNSTSGTSAKPHKQVNKAKPPVASHPRKSIQLSFPLSKNAARVNLVFLTSGLRLTLKTVSTTSSSLLKDLTDTYGPPSSGASNCFASLDVVADGPENPPSPSTTGTPGASIADRYLSRYRKYLDHVTMIRQWALDTPVQAGMRKQRDELVRATDDLSRDISVIIAGLERLSGPTDEETGSVVTGLEASIGRIRQSSDRLDQLLKELSQNQ